MPAPFFVSLPVADLEASHAFYAALGLRPEPRFSGDGGACLRWGEVVHVMLISHARWRTLTSRPFPAPGSAGHMLSLSVDSRAAVDAMNDAAAAHGGIADANPPEDLGFMYSRDIADPDGHLWGLGWMAPPAG